MALGHWDVFLAQAMAEEVAERRKDHDQAHDQTHDQEAERHGQRASEQQQQQFRGIARVAGAKMDAIEKEALTALLLQPGGDEQLRSYLAEPLLCGACLNLAGLLVECQRGCGRRLCPECRSEDGMCRDFCICDQPHPMPWRAAIKLLSSDSEMFARWQTAAKHADLHPQHVRRRSRRAHQNTGP